MKKLMLTMILAGLSMIGPFAMDTYLPAFPAIRQTFSITDALLQQTLSAYLGALSIMGLLYGVLSDSFGRRPVVLGSLVLFCGASVGAALAPGFGWLLFFRCLQGLSAGAGVIISQAIVRDLFSGLDAQQMLASITTVFGLAPAMAPILGGYLHVHFGWRAIFVFLAFYAFLLVVACAFRLPETLSPDSRQSFRPGAWMISYRSVAGSPAFLLRACGVACLFGGMGLYIASGAAFVMHILHARETSFAVLFIPMVGGLVAGSLGGSVLARRLGFDRLLRACWLVMALACLGNMAATGLLAAPQVFWLILPIAFYTLGLGGAMPIMNLAVLDLFPGMRGMAASLLNCMQMAVFAFISGVLAPVLFNSAFRLSWGLAGCYALASCAWWCGSRQAPSVKQGQPCVPDSQAEST